MNVLVIGSGAREHALAWKIKQSPLVKNLYVVPGNDGIKPIANVYPLDQKNIKAILDFAKEKKIDFALVGQELTLSLGIKDLFEQNNIELFGPNKKAAILESSKAFAKDFMSKYNIPTAAYSIFDDYKRAKAFIDDIGMPVVIKADGLASGKGVFVCFSLDEAYKALESLMIKKSLKEAGKKVVIEEFLEGEELSYMIALKNDKFFVMPSSQDHKRLLDNDQGPNTGGMGAYSPAPLLTEALEKEIQEKVVLPTIKGLLEENLNYEGFLYFGLMITNKGPYVLEYNVRLGDPETQALMLRIENDFLESLLKLSNGESSFIDISEDYSVCVVLATKDYPYKSSKEVPIKNLEEASKEAIIFHASTRLINGEYYAYGGRVLSVCAKDRYLKKALEKAYKAANLIEFDGKQFRKDIAQKAFKYIKD